MTRDAKEAAEKYAVDKAHPMLRSMYSVSRGVFCEELQDSFLAGYAKAREDILKLLRSDEAKHSWFNRKTNQTEDLRPDHIGPSLMSAPLWAKWLEEKLK